MKKLKDIKLSVLDLAPIVEGSNASVAFQNSLDLAQHTDIWGYHRYWVAEHHSMSGIASSATSVVLGFLAGNTSKIRIGSGGIMLPNHAPLVIAEQFGTLESMYPGRIDLGLGRAPGSDQLTAKALRRDVTSGQDFPELLEELRYYFEPSEPPFEKKVRAVPGEGLNIPIYLLGSSGFSARLAGELGLPFAFASHFSPDYTIPAATMYRESFKPGDTLSEPYLMMGVSVIVAETDEKAQMLSTSHQQAFLNLIRGTPGKLRPPVESMDKLWSPYEKEVVQKQLKTAIVGSPSTVKEKLQRFLEETGADEFIIQTSVYEHKERLESYELLKELST